MEVLRVDTALALSNGITASILIPAAVKREVYRQLKYRGVKHNMIVARMFAAGLFLLLRDYLGSITTVIIDVEYEGWDAIIRGLLLARIRKVSPCIHKDQIGFGYVGKKSPAHKVALEVFRKKHAPGKKINAQGLLSLC
ncbi:MAG TPA: hypothetical protein G4N99_13035 [Thermoflexia bacterium]|nr:hypothetical protein [Thermoflexia bacterium]